MPEALTWGETALRMAAAFLLPLLIGAERYIKKKPIDFRPFVIISVAAAGLMMVSFELPLAVESDRLGMEITRIMGSVITGIGFLGAGAMFRDGDFVQGAGTAASIWGSGAIGLMCGLGELWLALVVTGLIFSILVVGAPFADKWDGNGGDK